MKRAPRLAMMLLPGLDHFTADILARLPAASGWEVRPFRVTSQATLAEALAWLDDPASDAIWFEFCWPPFPEWIGATDFGGRRVIVRVHRIEAVETNHVASTSWDKVSDVIVVSPDMRERVLAAAPEIEFTSRLHLVPNGVDTERFKPSGSWNPFRIGWCGLMTLRKNPTFALQILAKLRTIDNRYEMHLCGMGGEKIAEESFQHLARQLGLESAIHWDGRISQAEMPAWHAENGLLLHTSLHEGFSYAILEAAASGCDLAIFDYSGASAYLPAKTLFRTTDEAVKIIRQARQSAWRETISLRYSVAHQIEALAKILKAISVHVESIPVINDDVKNPHSGDIYCQYGKNVKIHEIEIKIGGKTRCLAHRGTRSDLASLHQCLVQKQYDLPANHVSHRNAISEIFGIIKASGKIPIIVDCGANIGASVNWFAMTYPGSRIVAVEPARDNVEFLRKNTIGLNCELREEAISSSCREVSLIDTGRGSTAYCTESDLPGKYTVKTITINNILEFYKEEIYSPFIMKIDIEGHESHLFSKYLEVIDRFPFIFIELHDWLFPGKGSSCSFFRFHADREREMIQFGETFCSISKNVFFSLHKN